MSKTMNLVMSNEVIAMLSKYRIANVNLTNAETKYKADKDSADSVINAIQKKRESEYAKLDKNTMSFFEYEKAKEQIDSENSTVDANKKLMAIKKAWETESSELRADIKSALEYVPANVYDAYKVGLMAGDYDTKGECGQSFVEVMDDFLKSLGVDTVGGKVRKLSNKIAITIGGKFDKKKCVVKAKSERTFDEEFMISFINELVNRGTYALNDKGMLVVAQTSTNK